MDDIIERTMNSIFMLRLLSCPNLKGTPRNKIFRFPLVQERLDLIKKCRERLEMRLCASQRDPLYAMRDPESLIETLKEISRSMNNSANTASEHIPGHTIWAPASVPATDHAAGQAERKHMHHLDFIETIVLRLAREQTFLGLTNIPGWEEPSPQQCEPYASDTPNASDPDRHQAWGITATELLQAFANIDMLRRIHRLSFRNVNNLKALIAEMSKLKPLSRVHRNYANACMNHLGVWAKRMKRDFEAMEIFIATASKDKADALTERHMELLAIISVNIEKATNVIRGQKPIIEYDCCTNRRTQLYVSRSDSEDNTIEEMLKQRIQRPDRDILGDALETIGQADKQLKRRQNRVIRNIEGRHRALLDHTTAQHRAIQAK